MHDSPPFCAYNTSSSGVNVPSENWVCRWRSANFISFYITRRTENFPAHLVEDSIDELAAVLGGKLFSNVHRLIDAHHGRNVLPVKHFKNGQPHDIAVHGGDTVKIP